jgi:transposase
MELKATPDKVDQMADMIARGYSCRKIALHFDIHPTNVQRALKRRGVEFPRYKKREITADVLSQVRALRDAGTAWWRVEEIMGYSVNQLRIRLQESEL